MKWIKTILLLFLIGIILAISCFFYAKYEYRHIKTTNIKMITTKNVAPMKIVFLADFQYDLGWESEYLQEDLLREIVEKTNAEQPDLILLGGDYLNFAVHTTRVSELLGKLTATQGVYGILGNHDYSAKQRNQLVELFTDQGIIILENQQENLDGLSLCGVDDSWMGDPSLDNCMIDEQRLNFLLSHNPDYFELLTPQEKQQFDLTLSGHLHGGQITFFGIRAVPGILPSDYGEKYRYGLKHYDDSYIYITSGLGGSVMTEPLRFGAKPEMVVIEIENGIVDEIKI